MVRSFALASVLLLLVACDSESSGDGNSGAGAGDTTGSGVGAGDVTGSSSTGDPCCPPRGDLGPFKGVNPACTNDGFNCPWLYGDTGAVGGGVATCQGGEWNSQDCPAFPDLAAGECPPDGTDLGPCEALWKDVACLCACPGAQGEGSCGGTVSCRDGRWIMGFDVTDELQCP